MLLPEGLIFERGSRGRAGWSASEPVATTVEPLPEGLRREDDLDGMPEVSAA